MTAARPLPKGRSLDAGTRAEKTFALRMIEWADPESLRDAPPKPRHGRARPSDPAASFEKAVAATLRGVAARPVRIDWHPHRAEIEGPRCTLPLLPRGANAADRRELRGTADGFALRLRLHDPVLHAALGPETPDAADLYDILERARCAALGARLWPGMVENLAASADFALAARIPGDAAPPVAVMLDAVLATALAGLPLAPALRAAVPRWRLWLEAEAGLELDALAGAIGDQAGFAVLARPVAMALARYHRAAPATAPQPAPARGDDRETDRRETEAIDGGEIAAAAPVPAASGPTDTAARYAVFTRAHDRTVDATLLADDAELDALRRQLDDATASDHRTLARLAARLQRRLMARQQREWRFDLEEGTLDAGRLSRIVVNPGMPLSFKQEMAADFRDTVVALLVDNSGSMRGRPIVAATAAADLLAAALERAGVKVEILGFTTRAIRGGESRRDWIVAGRPAGPGRLTDLLHIVYKDADMPYRRARRTIAAALKPGLMRENVDGEALEWAVARLRRRHEQRRVLVVISDGAPSDEATLAANGPDILARHLRDVVARIEQAGDIDLRAIGIGHDVGRYYRAAVTLKSEAGLARFLFEEVDRVFAG